MEKELLKMKPKANKKPKNILKIKKLVAEAKLPTKAYSGDLGYDLYSVENVVIEPKNMAIIGTGIAVEFPANIGGIVKDRSSYAAKGLHCLAGVIDNGYRGEIKIVLYNLGKEPQRIQKGDKIAQMIPIQIQNFSIKEVANLGGSERNEKGFGSSDK